uniref:Recep_L_domain domain-containing protein n=2 Tax=Caenorhabditis tropicalis TaxID=1561998 RepID=A0A1I7UQV2_9PELO
MGLESSMPPFEVIVSKKTEYGIYLVDNPSLCLTEMELEKFLLTEKFYAPHIRICDPTKNYCRLDSFDFFDETNIPFGCQVLTDSLVLNGTKDINETDFESRLKDIEEIFGSVIVFESDVVSLKFPSLWRIYNYQPDLPVIFLQDNPNLQSIELSNLSSVPYFGKYPDVLYAFSNPLLTQLSLDTCENLSKLGQITIGEVSDSICDNKTMTADTQNQNHTMEFLSEGNGKTGNNSTTLSSVEKVSNRNVFLNSKDGIEG